MIGSRKVKPKSFLTSLTKAKAKEYKCIGGPWDGQTIKITDETRPCTLFFSVNGCKHGRYVGNHLEVGADRTKLVWETRR